MLDELLGVLADGHRRLLLVTLLDHKPQAEIQIPEGVQQNTEKLSTLQLELHHHHLPRLAEAGFIEWDRDQHVVTRGPAFKQIKPILELFEENADDLPVRWP